MTGAAAKLHDCGRKRMRMRTRFFVAGLVLAMFQGTAPAPGSFGIAGVGPRADLGVRAAARHRARARLELSRPWRLPDYRGQEGALRPDLSVGSHADADRKRLSPAIGIAHTNDRRSSVTGRARGGTDIARRPDRRSIRGQRLLLRRFGHDDGAGARREHVHRNRKAHGPRNIARSSGDCSPQTAPCCSIARRARTGQVSRRP